METSDFGYVAETKVKIFAQKFEAVEQEASQGSGAKRAKVNTAALVAVLQQAGSISAPKLKRKAASVALERLSAASSSGDRKAASVAPLFDGPPVTRDGNSTRCDADDDGDASDELPDTDASDFFNLPTLK